MSALVSLHHNEPMTTSLAISEGVELTHKTVIQLVRKYVDDLSEWGGVAFEMLPFDTEGGKQWREIAYLNEPQATLLMTFMRNSEIVIKFKKALVRAFFDLRDRAASSGPSRSDPLNMSHRADIAVATDRTFRSWMRTSRALGLAKPAAIRLANEKTLAATGIDVIAEAGYKDDPERIAEISSPVRFAMAWLAGELDLPVISCAGADLYRAYCEWSRQQADPWPLSHNLFSREVKRMPGMWGGVKAVRNADGGQCTRRVFIPDSDQPEYGAPMCDLLADRLPEFAHAVEQFCTEVIQ